MSLLKNTSTGGKIKLLACEFIIRVPVLLSYLSHVPERAEDRQPPVSYVPAVAIWHQRCFRGAFRKLLPFHNIWLGRRLLFFLGTIPTFRLFFQVQQKKKVEWSQKLLLCRKGNCLRRAYAHCSQLILALCGESKTQQLQELASLTRPRC